MDEYFPETPRLSDFLRSTEVIDADHPAVQVAAECVASPATDEVGRARLLFEFVRDKISHTGDAGGGPVTCRASDVLAQRSGLCYAKSHLLAAMLRAVGIPAGFCYQRLSRNPPDDGFDLHGLNGVYLAGLGRWIRVDPRGNKPGVDAQFDEMQERLAFCVDPSKGEFTYPAIYAEPAACVVAALTAGKAFGDLWTHLPSELPVDGDADRPSE